jgi:hypothetical protein
MSVETERISKWLDNQGGETKYLRETSDGSRRALGRNKKEQWERSHDLF